MWLLPILNRLLALSANTFYRLTIAGEAVPKKGAVLLIANHPNSLVDPVFVASAAGRPVRFLAKATLFHHPAVGFLVRGSGAIPVYRRVDDPAQMERNVDTFRAAHAALAEGSAVALFPEGVSHSEPALMPLKTGAARIAFGALEAGSTPFPIIPIGIVLRARETFRSEALVVVGPPVAWDDLRGMDDHREAVGQLNDRMDEALRRVTVNLERWEDQPIVEAAEAVWAAEMGANEDAADRLVRLERTADLLHTVRGQEEMEWQALARRLQTHSRKLVFLGLTPGALAGTVSLAQAASWTARRLPLTGAIVVVGIGSVLFWAPYRLIGWRDRRQALERDVRATHKLLGGTVVMAAWIMVLSLAAGALWGIGAGLLALVFLPVLGLATVWLRDWWGVSWLQARRFLLLRRQPVLRDELRTEQRAIAGALEDVNRRYPAP
jgi:glycerol-3-phosphate O-acyltransferase/dihydroxyacetone phosphate acyltransferase